MPFSSISVNGITVNFDFHLKELEMDFGDSCLVLWMEERRNWDDGDDDEDEMGWGVVEVREGRCFK